MITFKVEAELNNQRLDKITAKKLKDVSRMVIKTSIDQGDVLVNGQPVKAAYKVKAGDEITVNLKAEEPPVLTYQPVDFEIVYEDAYLIIINKPSGLIVHPSHTTTETTLVHGLLKHIDPANFKDPLRPGIVHRLDKDTSGLLVVAKDQDTLSTLQSMLKKRTVKRTYQALVEGVIDHNKGTIEAPVGRHPKRRHIMSVHAEGKESTTHFTVLERFKDHTLVECQLDTGRTHQIRVHMQYIDHPVVGDPTYGFRKSKADDGQYLHATVLQFSHPITAELLTFKAELPTMFLEKLQSLR